MERAELQPFQLSELLSRDVPERFRRQVVDYGFFYLQGHGIADSLHEGAKGAAMSLFVDGSIETKQLLKSARKDIRRGYSELEAESTASVTNSGSFSDYSMCFSMGSNENVFPSKVFETAWTNYYAALKVLSECVARVVMAGAAGLLDDAVDQLFPCEPLLRLRYFPEVPDHRTADKIPLRMASHYDLSIVTLIQQTPCANGFVSLYARIGDQAVGLPPLPDTVLVLCGAVATIASRGLLPAPRHYVASPPLDRQVGSSRTSSVFFLRPNADFRFSVREARSYGLDVTLNKETATFADWIGVNYTSMHTREKV